MSGCDDCRTGLGLRARSHLKTQTTHKRVGLCVFTTWFTLNWQSNVKNIVYDISRYHILRICFIKFQNRNLVKVVKYNNSHNMIFVIILRFKINIQHFKRKNISFRINRYKNFDQLTVKHDLEICLLFVIFCFFHYIYIVYSCRPFNDFTGYCLI